MTTVRGWWARTWARERDGWAADPWQWKLLLFISSGLVLQVVSGALRGDRWFTGVCAVSAVLGFTLTALAHQGSRPGDDSSGDT